MCPRIATQDVGVAAGGVGGGINGTGRVLPRSWRGGAGPGICLGRLGIGVPETIEDHKIWCRGQRGPDIGFERAIALDRAQYEILVIQE